MVEILGDIKKCIYCGSEKSLSDEHPLPFSLHGKWLLKNASCIECSKITSKFERDVSQNLFGSIRSYLNFPTYHPKNRRKFFLVEVEKNDGSILPIKTPITEYGGIIGLPIFQYPAYKNNTSYIQGINLIGIQPYRIGGFDIKSMAKKHSGQAINLSIKYNPTNFARMLAKASYGFAVAKYGMNKFDAFVLPAILGKKDDIGMWVGTDTDENALFSSEELIIELYIKKKLIFSRVKLFGNLEQSPCYLIVVGKLK